VDLSRRLGLDWQIFFGLSSYLTENSVSVHYEDQGDIGFL